MPFLVLLLGIVALCAIPLYLLGRSEFISYDGWWHIFIARIGNWRATFEDIRDNAHPPLFYVVLHYVAKLGHGRLVYRSAVIIPGLAAVFYIGRIGSQLFTSRALALLAAAAYGFSMAFIDLSLDVRSYTLALLFVLAASYYFFEWIRDPAGKQAPGAFLLFCSLASLGITTEYYAAFFPIALFVVVVIYFLRYAEFRALMRDWVSHHWKIMGLSFLIPLYTVFILYRRHLRYLPKEFNHIGEYYWDRHTGHLGKFLLGNLLHVLNYFSPVRFSSTIVAALFFAALAVLICVYALAGRFSLRRMTAGIPGLVVVVLICELAAAAIAGRYPFGGEMRQQSIVFPFLLLGVFALLDWILALGPSLLTYGACAVIVVAIAADFNYGWKRIVWTNEDSMFLADYRQFVGDFPHAPVVVTDEFSSVFYLMGTNDSRWTYVGKLGMYGLVDYQRIDEFKITNPSGEQQIFLRDKDDWLLRLRDPSFYPMLADCLRDAHVNDADLFTMVQISTDPTQADRAPASTIQALASSAGLSVDDLFLKPNYSFLHVHLRN